MRELWEMYQAEMKPRRRAFADVEMVWHRWGEPVVGNVRLDDINMRHGAELVAAVVKHSTPNRARKVVRYLSPMLGFAAGRGLIPGNPWAGLHLPEGVKPRDHVVSPDQWQALWTWGQDSEPPWGPFFAFLMLSAQRLNEVAAMRWDEVEGDVWAIPAARHKSKRRHDVPLSAALVDLLHRVEKHDAFVFSVRHGRPGLDPTRNAASTSRRRRYPREIDVPRCEAPPCP